MDVLQSLDVSKSCSPDLINARLLKGGAQYLQTPLKHLFNFSLNQCEFPAAWKRANLTPIHKKNEKTLPNNYRPVSLLSNVGKSLERCVHKHIYNYVIENNNDSITNQLPGRVAQSVGHLTRKSGVLGSIPGLATYFRFSFRFFKKGSCQLLAKVCARSTG